MLKRSICIGVLTSAVCAGCIGGAKDDLKVADERAGLTATSGSLDVSFGNRGKVTTAVNPNGIASVVLQPDGKIVVAVTLDDFNVASQVFGVVRYLANGTLDQGFGTGGVTRIALTIGFNVANSVAIAADGKIVVVGSTSNANNSTRQVAVARLDANGALDRTFGSSGTVATTALGTSDVANVVLLQPDGKILVGGGALAHSAAGSGYSRRIIDTLLLRYNANGVLDSTFGSSGEVVLDVVGAINTLALEPDGSILALDAGRAGNNGVARFTSNGTLAATTLSGTLIAVTSTSNATFQQDGRVVLGGSAQGISRRDIDVHLVRFSLTGAVDSTFNSPVFDFAGQGIPNRSNSVQAIIIAPDGKIVAGGIASPDISVNQFGLARFNADGSLDPTFGTAGIVTTQFSGSGDAVATLARQPDGKIVAVGITLDNTTGTSAIAIARYLGP